MAAIEPVTELVLETPAGLVRVTRRRRGRQGHAGHVPQRPGVRRPSGRRRRRAGAGDGPGRCRLGRDVLRDRRRVAVRPPPGARRGRPDRTDRRDDQGGRSRTAAGRPSRERRRSRASRSPSSRGRPHDPGGDAEERRRRLDRHARLGSPRDVDRRDRPVPMRDRDLRGDGRVCTRRASSACTRTSSTRGSSALASWAGWSRRRASATGRRSCRRSAGGPGSRIRGLRPRRDRPVPRGLHVGDIWG